MTADKAEPFEPTGLIVCPKCGSELAVDAPGVRYTLIHEADGSHTFDPASWISQPAPDADQPEWGDVRHHQQRIEQLKDWVRQWKAKADAAERALADERAKAARVEALADKWQKGISVRNPIVPSLPLKWAMEELRAALVGDA